MLFALLLLLQTTPAHVLTDQQVQDAIELGRANTVPIVQVATILGVSTGDFDVYIEDPVARIAAAASAAFKQYRPFTANNVTNEMKAPLYLQGSRRS